MSERFAVVLFHTTSHALRSEKVLQKADVSCRLIPVPRHLSSDCGLCLRIERVDQGRVREILAAASVEMDGLHEI